MENSHISEQWKFPVYTCFGYGLANENPDNFNKLDNPNEIKDESKVEKVNKEKQMNLTHNSIHVKLNIYGPGFLQVYIIRKILLEI